MGLAGREARAEVVEDLAGDLEGSAGVALTDLGQERGLTGVTERDDFEGRTAISGSGLQLPRLRLEVVVVTVEIGDLALEGIGTDGGQTLHGNSVTWGCGGIGGREAGVRGERCNGSKKPGIGLYLANMEPIRLNKYLVDAGVCSRREADRLITLRKILVNGSKAELGQKVDGTERITVNGKLVQKPAAKRVYLAYHKPVGIICTSDPKAKDNIINAVKFPERVFHIGRLDVASSGLILLTNDGDVVNRILRAEGKHEKEYVVTIDKAVTDDFVKSMSTGIMIEGRKTLPAKVTKLGDTSFAITLVEGRNRQIRRMCEEMHVNVRHLERIRVMNIELSDLPVGTWRHLTETEEKQLLRMLGK